MKKIAQSSFCLAVLIVSGAQAADLRPAMELEHTAVLPVKVRSPRIRLLQLSLSERFNGEGTVEPIGNKLNKVVSWSDVLAAQATEQEKKNTLAILENQKLDPNGGPGRATGVVHTAASVWIPVFSIGMSPVWTIAVAAPVMKIDAQVDTGFIANEDGQRFIDGISESSPAKADEASRKLNNATQEKLKRLGYDPIAAQNFTHLGDVRVIQKVKLLNTSVHQVSGKVETTLPTGKKPNVQKALDLPTGDGQWDVGAGLAYDLFWLPELRSNVFVGANVQLADRLDRRLPTSATDALSADIEEVERDLGDQLSTGTSLHYTFNSVGLTLGAGYTYQYQQATHFAGEKFPQVRYGWLEAEFPFQDLHSAVASLQFSTVEWFRAKKFFYPMQANLNWSRAFAGHNTAKGDALVSELVLFF